MKRILGLSIAMYMVATGTGCEQPLVECTTGHGGFAAKYTLKPGSKTGMGSCDTLHGEIVGLEKYNPENTSEKQKQDLTKATLAIRPSELGQMAADAEDAGVSDPNPTHSPTSEGDFDSVFPDENDVCHVQTLTPGQQVLPPIDVKYEWSNVRVSVTTAYTGTRMAADLKYTKDGCSAEYSVLALWPAYPCDDGNGMPDITLCGADPPPGEAFGSGINPDFKDNVVCDPDLLMCVLKTAPQGLN